MPKSKKTLEIEQIIWEATYKQGTFGCFEVTIGWHGNERVDYMTYDTNRIFKCYEIKVTKSDFHSKSANTFIGHYNYYVMPSELYKEVKDEIPTHIGVYTSKSCTKRAKKQKLKIDEQILKDNLIRSLSREVAKQINSGNPSLIEYYKREAISAKQKAKTWYHSYQSVMKIITELYGEDWDTNYKEPIF